MAKKFDKPMSAAELSQMTPEQVAAIPGTEGSLTSPGAVGTFVPKEAAPQAPPTPPGGPSTVSSETAADKTKQNLDKLGTMQQPPAEKKQTTGQKETTGVTAEGLPEELKTQFDTFQAQNDQLLNQMNTLYDKQLSSVSAQAANQIATIQNIYAQKKQQMAELNKAVLGGQKIAGIRAGRQRYATEIQMSILSAEEAAGIQRLADLDMQEQQLIQQAQSAADEKSFQLLNQKMSNLFAIQKEKEANILKQYQMAMEYEKQAMAKAMFNEEMKEIAFNEFKQAALIGTEIKPELKQQVNAVYGENFAEDYINVQKQIKEAKSKEDYNKNVEDIVNILTKLPETEEIDFYVGDTLVTYSGLEEIDPKKGLYSTYETDAFGNVTQAVTKYNPETGKLEVVNILPLGKIGKGFKSSGGGGTSDDKEIKAFQKDAAELLPELEKGEISWGAAFDSLKLQYPQATNETINAALGGGIPYDPNTGFDTSKAFGRAVQEDK